MNRILLLFFILTGVAVCSADQSRPIVGAKAVGLGGAFVSIADDSTAIGWNPAGISRMRRFVLGNDFSRPFGIASSNRLSLIIPSSERIAFGLNWDRLAMKDEEIGFWRDEVRFCYSYMPLPSFSFGLNLKYLYDNASFHGVSLGSSYGWGMDLGIIIRPPQLKGGVIGLMAEDLLSLAGGRIGLGMSVRHDSGFSERLFKPRFRIGGAYRPNRVLLLSGQLDDMVRLGAQLSISPFSLRAGIQRPVGGGGITLSAGLGARYRGIEFNYACLVPPGLPLTSYFSISFNVDYQKPPVKIEAIKLREIYPAHRYFYARGDERAPVIQRLKGDGEEMSFNLHPLDGIGRIWMVNESRELVDVRIRLFIDGFTPDEGTVAVERIEVLPRHRISVPIRRLLLKEDVLKLNRYVPVEVKVEVTDLSDEMRKKATATTRTVIRSVNSLLMDEVAKLASFVSSRDKVVREFALETLKMVEDLGEGIDLHPAIFKAIALFDALYGMSYASDPNVPFESGTVDEVMFPRQILSMRRGRRMFGDCDDSTVLFCSLLESVGVHTALIKQPKHVLMAFELDGLTLERAQEIGLDERSYIPIGGYVWVPVETTLIGKGFAEAWRAGAQRMSSGVEDITTVQDAWERFGSPDVSAVNGWPEGYSLPPKDRLLERFRKDLNDPWISAWRGVR
jgi:hypothetical protein